jgi:Glycosyl transferase family 11
VYVRSLSEDTVYIGVHIRRSDMLADYNVKQGYTVADEDYLERAVTYITDVLIERITKHRNVTDDDVRQLSVAYIVCSDDRVWSTKHFNSAISRAQQKRLDGTDEANRRSGGIIVNAWKSISRLLFGETSTYEAKLQILVNETVVYSPGVSGEQDLAILSQCNHTIFTVGTFGWWAGYLAGGMTIYYKNFPAPQSQFERQFSKLDFFPPEWIGL